MNLNCREIIQLNDNSAVLVAQNTRLYWINLQREEEGGEERVKEDISSGQDSIQQQDSVQTVKEYSQYDSSGEFYSFQKQLYSLKLADLPEENSTNSNTQTPPSDAWQHQPTAVSAATTTTLPLPRQSSAGKLNQRQKQNEVVIEMPEESDTRLRSSSPKMQVIDYDTFQQQLLVAQTISSVRSVQQQGWNNSQLTYQGTNSSRSPPRVSQSQRLGQKNSERGRTAQMQGQSQTRSMSNLQSNRYRKRSEENNFSPSDRGRKMIIKTYETAGTPPSQQLLPNYLNIHNQQKVNYNRNNNDFKFHELKRCNDQSLEQLSDIFTEMQYQNRQQDQQQPVASVLQQQVSPQRRVVQEQENIFDARESLIHSQQQQIRKLQQILHSTQSTLERRNHEREKTYQTLSVVLPRMQAYCNQIDTLVETNVKQELKIQELESELKTREENFVEKERKMMQILTRIETLKQGYKEQIIQLKKQLGQQDG